MLKSRRGVEGIYFENIVGDEFSAARNQGITKSEAMARQPPAHCRSGSGAVSLRLLRALTGGRRPPSTSSSRTVL